MSNQASKISFGFSKVAKKTNILPQHVENKPKIELISAIEEKNLKIVGRNPEDDIAKKLVIPMTNNQKTTPLIKLMQEKKNISQIVSNRIKLEPKDHNDQDNQVTNGNAVKLELDNIKKEPTDETLEQQAVRELIEDLQNKEVKSEVKVFQLPINADELPLEGATESSLDDYDRIPISDFGKAMLRGMGWNEAEAAAKADKELDIPILRPKGMGLGADKVIKKQPLLIQPGQAETMEIKRNACVKVLAGKHKNFYGTIEGFDDGGGRVIVKLAIGGLKMTLNEFMVQPVSKQEFAKYGKILNSTKYEEFKSGEMKPTEPESATSKPTIKKESRRSRSYSPEERQNNSRSIDRKHSCDRDIGRSSKADYDNRARKSSKKEKHRRDDDPDGETSNRKYRGRSRSRDRKRSSSRSSTERYSKKKSSKKERRKRHSSPNSRYSSDDEKKHKKKSKRSKKQRSRS